MEWGRDGLIFSPVLTPAMFIFKQLKQFSYRFFIWDERERERESDFLNLNLCLFDVVLLNLYFYVIRFKLFIFFNCCIVMFELFLYFLILELLYCYVLRWFCNVRISFLFNFFYEFTIM